MPFDEWATVTAKEGGEQWDSTVRALKAQLQRAIDKDDSDTSSALKTAKELHRHWWRCQEFGRPDDAASFDRTEDRLTRHIEYLGEAIARQRRDSRRSTVSRLFRASVNTLRPSADSCMSSAVYYLDELDVIIHECVKEWGYDERSRAIHQEQIDRGLRPAYEHHKYENTRLPRHDTINYNQLQSDVAEATTKSGKASLSQMEIPNTWPNIPPPSNTYSTFASPTNTSHMTGPSNSTSAG